MSETNVSAQQLLERIQELEQQMEDLKSHLSAIYEANSEKAGEILENFARKTLGVDAEIWYRDTESDSRFISSNNEILDINKDNTTHIPIPGTDGKTACFVAAEGAHIDVDKVQRLQDNSILFQAAIEKAEAARSKEASLTDGLTNLGNRRKLDKYPETRLLDDLGQRPPVHIVMVDIDKFKNFNDTYGHAAGDEAINLNPRENYTYNK